MIVVFDDTDEVDPTIGKHAQSTPFEPGEFRSLDLALIDIERLVPPERATLE